MIFRVKHKNTFDYSQDVSISHHILHLTPRDTGRQACQHSTIIVDPAASLRLDRTDYFGNMVTYLTVQEPHQQLNVMARSEVQVRPIEDFDSEASPAWEDVAEQMRRDISPDALDALQYSFDSPFVHSTEDIYRFALESFPAKRPMLDAVKALTAAIFTGFEYEGGVTDLSTPAQQVLETRKGVCQDFAHLQIACLRSLGLSARYVSGYLLTHPPEGQERLVGADASHAWLSVWCPHNGWVDFDPTNNLVVSDEHVTLAWGRDYGDVSPIKGFMLGGGSHQINVEVDVLPVDCGSDG